MKEMSLSIGGNPYTFTALTAVDMQAVLDEYKTSAVDPVKQLLETASMLPDTLRDEFTRKHLDDAIEAKKKMGTLNDPGFQSFLSTVEGASKFIPRMLKKYHPHLSPDQGLEIFVQGVAEHGDEIFLGLHPTKHA